VEYKTLVTVLAVCNGTWT